ncbi:MAG: signal recognition particle protein [Candidatus Symbiobacter sp.]|nr:signal recognition particle protein [Candidatus Symbiobacter sp.]
MFDSFGQKITGIFDRLTRRGALSEADVQTAMREIRIALLEADVALPVVKDFIATTTQAAIGQNVLRSITPGQMVVKIVHDQLIAMLEGRLSEPRDGGNQAPTDNALNFRTEPPAVILMVGLQGSGKTTSTAKLAKRITERERKSVMMASLDTQRPAAQEQLAILGRQAKIQTLPIVAGESPLVIAKRALKEAKTGGFDVLLLDSAGRLAIDAELMAEISAIHAATKPIETLLVADALTGQDAVNTASHFDQQIGVTGIILTRIDGDGRGGAALSMRAVTGKPIKFLGAGEKLDALEDFDAERLASRILGMGDIIGLVEKAMSAAEMQDMEQLAAKMQKGSFDLDDFALQLRQMRKMGGMSGLMGLLPGVAKAKRDLQTSGISDRDLLHQEAIISSMTRRERRDWRLLNAKRKIRIAKGSGTDVPQINRLLKQFQQTQKMMKMVGGMNKSAAKSMLGGGALGANLGGAMGGGAMGGGAMPDMSKFPNIAGLGGAGGSPPDLKALLGGGGGGSPQMSQNLNKMMRDLARGPKRGK